MMVGSMAVVQSSGISCPQMVSRSGCRGKVQQRAVVGISLGRASRIDSTLSLARASSSVGAIFNQQSGVISSSSMLPGLSHIKGGIKGLTIVGNFWQRRIRKGGARCQLAGASPSQEDEFDKCGPDVNTPSATGGNETVQFDLNLPRRSALLEFTCNICKARTKRMVNPDAFRRGTIFVQCGGCEAFHKLVDNLNLVEEFDFRNEVDPTTADLGI